MASSSGATTASPTAPPTSPPRWSHDDYVFCSTGYGAGSALLELKPAGDGVQADEVYFLKGKELQNHHGGMVMIGDYVYWATATTPVRPTCLEWKTGKIVWRHPRSGQRHGGHYVCRRRSLFPL